MKHASMDPNRGHAGRARVGASYVQVPERQHRVRAKDVPCPECHVEAEEDCVTTGSSGRMRVPVGTVMGAQHPVRRRMAVRRDNEKREAEGTMTPVDPERKPGVREDPKAPLCSGCGLHIRLSSKGVFLSHDLDGGVSAKDLGRCRMSREKP